MKGETPFTLEDVKEAVETLERANAAPPDGEFIYYLAPRALDLGVRFITTRKPAAAPKPNRKERRARATRARRGIV